MAVLIGSVRKANPLIPSDEGVNGLLTAERFAQKLICLIRVIPVERGPTGVRNAGSRFCEDGIRLCPLQVASE
jgi:hypothetical protein